MFALAAVLAAAALFVAALALLVWVAFRYYTLAISLDSAILRELRARPLKQFINNPMKPTEGDFVANSDEELFIQEQVKALRDQGHGGITDEELKAFVSQAVSEKV